MTDQPSPLDLDAGMTERDIQAVEAWIAEFEEMVESAAAEAQQVIAGATALIRNLRAQRAAVAALTAERDAAVVERDALRDEVRRAMAMYERQLRETEQRAARVKTTEQEREAARAALAGLVGCIDGSAADNGPPVTRGSMMAQVCKVLQKTGQYDAARAALLGRAREGTA